MNLIEQIDKPTLQYRREHNIFETGDLIVFIDRNDKTLMIYAEYATTSPDGVCRHATDEEIKAGKRL